ncbi:MAG: ABC transporter ATP-binding protein [Myxococcales bacterium]|nr:ABC transporter ATP-binding protein [Myxococcales bacterium]
MNALRAVRVAGLGRLYDDHYALVGLDAAFPAGQITALLGPNGAGKSTLMGILSTLMRPSEGDVFFDDRRVTDAAAQVRSMIGYVGHRTMLYPPLTARENLRFFGKLYGVPQLDARVSQLIDTVGLSADADRPVAGFSRGMSQRLTLARALLPSPALLLLDEPFTGLDQDGVSIAVDLLAAERVRGAVLILVSHDLPAAGRLADRALILRRGRKLYEGPVEEPLAALYDRALAKRRAA